MHLYPVITLKPERDKPLRNFHPWVFLGAIEAFPEFQNGSILRVVNSASEFLGYGYFNKGQSIVGRMISFREGDPVEAIKEHIQTAVDSRAVFKDSETNAYRLINGEGDSVPGLIVDRYDDVLVVQINTLGIEVLKTSIVSHLVNLTGITNIFEKSNSPTRRKEGLPDVAGWFRGTHSNSFTVLENGLKFEVDLGHAQKTGLFLDQREMRSLVKKYAPDKAVLNCFGYTGGFTVAALAGGARKADTVDIDEHAAAGTIANLGLNNFNHADTEVFTDDVFEFLQNKTTEDTYDFIILDPPAFAKRSSDIANATRGYRELNRLALEKLPKGGLLLTSSCSAHVDTQLFQSIIFQAAKQARREVKILSRHILAADHPVNLYFPEGDYLKSLFLRVN